MDLNDALTFGGLGLLLFALYAINPWWIAVVIGTTCLALGARKELR